MHKVSLSKRSSTRRWALAIALTLSTLPASTGQSEEPAEMFVEQMRVAGNFDLVLEYLNRASSYPGISPQFIEAIDLERAQTLLEASQQSRMADKRDQYYADATAALQRFVSAHPNHARQPEARLQLGNLQMMRGTQLMEIGGEPTPERRTKALEAYSGAAGTFNAIVDELRVTLQGMQGEKIDAQKEPEKIALRDGYRKDYLQALLAGGEAMKLAGDTFASTTPEQTKWYKDALARFLDMSDKYDDTLAGVLANLYAAQVHLALGEAQPANDRFLMVIDQPDSDVIRPTKAKAVIGLMRGALAQSPPAFQAAIDRGQPWADDIRPDERNATEFQELRMVLADAYLGLMETEENAGDKRKSANAARALLLPVSKVPGRFQDAASQHLAKLGVGEDAAELAAATELPKTFADAIDLARDIMDEEKNLTLTSQLLEQRQQQGEALDADLTKVREDLSKLRNRGVDVLRHALTLVTSETEENSVNQARYWLAFMLLRAERYYESAVVGEFIARRYPANELALPSGLTALSSWQLAYRDAPPEKAASLLPQLQRTAEFMTRQWPQDPQVAGARELLVRIAIGRNDLVKAREFLAQLPDDNPSKMDLQQSIGRLMWNESVQLKKDGDAEGAKRVREEMIATLSAGLGPLKNEQVDANVLRASLLLSRAQLLNDNPGQALAALDHETYGALKRINDVKLDDDALKGEVYGIGLQALVSQLTSGQSESDNLMSRASQMMDGLQQAYAGQSDGETKLAQTFFRLANDIREQMETAPPVQQERLTQAFQLFLSQLAQKSDDARILHWAGQTLVGMAEGQMKPGESKASGTAAQLVASATEILKRVESKGAQDPKWLGSEKMLTQVRMELGTAARLAGDYPTALGTLATLLAENQNLVDAQVQAALVYEQWGAELKNNNHALASYGRAISGSKPDSRGQNTIWGWGTIARRTMGNESFQETFFNARYHLALSRYLMGKKEANPDKSKKVIEQALSDVRAVYVRYPDLGGVGSKNRFDALVKEIQKALGQTANGLAGM